MPEHVNRDPQEKDDAEQRHQTVRYSSSESPPLTTRLDETLVLPPELRAKMEQEQEPLREGLLRLELVDTKQTMTIPIKDIILLGRPDPVTGKAPDIDFTRLAGYRMGVSRSHAEIHWYHDNILKVYDLGSSNGTFVNGKRLGANQAYPLYNGDELRLGQLALYVYYEIDPSTPSATVKTETPPPPTVKEDDPTTNKFSADGVSDDPG
ncbi:MAG TPA: FHA domain-containing protein, partial [Aggregatilineales bacterium]|nr:FHA domain-containing protein [Aggregatilineales bacterium]